MEPTWYVLRRVSAPDRVWEMGEASDAFGGAAPWWWGVPGAFHALANPRSVAPMPARPESGCGRADALGYWMALHVLLVVQLGWAVPHRGLRWWYEAGKPTEDATLKLVSQVWDDDGDLDVYLAWLLIHQQTFEAGRAWAEQFGQRDDLGDRWQTFVDRTIERSADIPWLDLGDRDALHISGHLADEEDTPMIVGVGGRFVGVDESARRAVYIADSATMWPSSFAADARNLPSIGDRSWQVDVFVRPIGFMGTYRRSRVTGRWFTGRHSVHEAGN